MSESLTSLLASRKASIELEKVSTNNSKSIELERSQTQTPGVDIPEAVDDLIDNKMYRNKFRKLIREGHLHDLLELTTIAQEKDKPSHWFRQNFHDVEEQFDNYYYLMISRTQQWQTGVLRVRLPRRLLPQRQDIEFLTYASLDHTVDPIKREPGQVHGPAHEMIWPLPQPLKLEHRYEIRWSYPHGGSIYQVP